MQQPLHPESILKFPVLTGNSNIPIDYIHSVAQPFCRDFTCACHQNQRQIAALLVSVYEGQMTLREAANFADKGAV